MIGPAPMTRIEEMSVLLGIIGFQVPQLCRFRQIRTW
jgi:hypothetical protein